MTNPVDLSQALNLPSERAKCAGTCGDDVLFHEPALRPGELVYCVPCGEKLFGKEKTPKGADYLRIRQHPAERIAALVADRYEKRHGEPPPKEAVFRYKATYNNWRGQVAQLDQIADDFERLRRDNPVAWARPYPVKPADPFVALGKIARTLASILEQRRKLEAQGQELDL